MTTAFEVVVVDDNADDVSVFRTYLRQASGRQFRFTEAATGEAGLTACRRDGSPPGCVLLDLHLPDMDGIDVLKELQDPEGFLPFPVVMLLTGGITSLIGTLIGLPALRLSGLYLALITLLAAPFAFVALTAGSPSIYYPAIIVAELLLFMSTGPINSAIVNMVSPTQRASALALSMFTIHLLGDVPSPTLIGWLSDTSSLAKAVMIVP